MIENFAHTTLRAGSATVAVWRAGTGSPVLLLHGFPQTHEAWRRVAPALTDAHSVVCIDLPGYGESRTGRCGAAAMAKRATAATLVDVMARLGHERFAVVGHDRGALAALRLALDHGDRVTHLGVLDVVPTVDLWEHLSGVGGVFAFHLFLLAQPSALPETMIAADPDTFFGHFLDSWTKVEGAIEPAVRARYLDACRHPEVLRAICDDYRASAFVDAAHEERDRAVGRRLTMPTLALWQDPDDVVLPFDPAAIWSSWATDLSSGTLPCGHFLPEEKPDEVARAVRELLAG